ncbi:MAG: DUF7347 domain-containing protein [Candidatus Asgardarchaeia archaeon]
MSEVDESIYEFIGAISHPTRVNILKLLYDRERLTYSDIMNALGLDTGKLNFHLKKLKGLVDRREDGYYYLSSKGKLALSTLKAISEHMGSQRKDSPHGKLLIKRAMAWVLDILLISFFGSGIISPEFYDLDFFGIVHIPVPAFFYNVTSYYLFLNNPQVDQYSIFIRFYIITLLWAYWTITEGYRGQSIGKVIFGIKVVKRDGSSISMAEAAFLALGKSILLLLDFSMGIILRLKYKGDWVRFTEFYVHARTIESKIIP